jgi:dihydroorotase
VAAVLHIRRERTVVLNENVIRLRKPDDWHVHFRDGYLLAAVAPLTARQFGRALAMPNLVPPVTTVEMGRSYRERIRAAARDLAFEPHLAVYLTDATDPEELRRGFEEKVFLAAKLYPVGATTNSAAGVTGIGKVRKALEVMEDIGMPLCIHGETVMYEGRRVDPYDREKVFIETELHPLRKEFRELKIVLEHVTTREGAAYVAAHGGKYLAATVTAHHLWASRTDVFEGGMCTDYHCLPVIKRDEDRAALRKAIASGSPHFFLGTDSAPHLLGKKRQHRAPGGVFTAKDAIEIYAQVFEDEGVLDYLEAFASLRGPAFYGLEPNEGTVTLRRTERTVDELVEVPGADDTLWPFLYEERPEDRQTLRWQLA